jgi:DNA end-binding protein Ku
MRRPIWTGAVSFGLVNVPVKLFSAIAPKAVHFHLLHDADGARIHQRRVCSLDEQEVPYEHVVRGFEVSKGRYVTVTPEELAALDPEATRTIDIEAFVDLADIDPIYYEQTYHVLPGDRAEKAYSLLFAAMKAEGKVAIARFVMRTKQYLCALRPMDQALSLSTMLYEDEIVPLSEIEAAPRHIAPSARELSMAEQLVQQLATAFEPSRYHDEHRERVLELIEKKAEGEAIEAPLAPAPHAEVVDIMQALRASLAAAKRGEAASERPARAPSKKPAASAVKTKRPAPKKKPTRKAA